MASYFGKRMRSITIEDDLNRSAEKYPIRFLCLKTDSTDNSGSLKVVENFAKFYGADIPGRVYLHLPSGAIWFGTYVQNLQRIIGLENFLTYYNIKPYNVVVLEYFGASDFGVEIFNCYALEIDYGLKDIPFSNGVCCNNHLGLVIDGVSGCNEIENDKYWSSLSYNAKSTWSAAHELLINENHLQDDNYYKILTGEACLNLDLNSSMKWLHLGFKKHMWNINLKWEEDEVYFDREWNYFAKNIRLSVGDICLFLNTSHPQRFQIAIFEKATVCNLYRAGCSSRKGLLKFYKVMSYENIYSGEMEVPRLFLNEFGEVKGGNIRLFLADGCQFSGYVCESSHVMIGLKDILGKYSVSDHYVLFFDYVGSSTFYVSIYNTLGMNIFNKMEEKLLVEELVKQVQFVTKGMIERDVGDAAGVSVVGVQISDVPLNYFIVDLKKCNVAQTGHGVYFARHLFSIYRTWRNGTILNVIHDEQTWRVAVHRKKKMCRFGRGWDQFAKASKLKEGQKLKFCHVSDHTFAVTSV